MRHPEIGELTPHREKLIVAGTGGRMLVGYHAEPGTASADNLALLGTLAATNQPTVTSER